jgi:hypothetical protein
MASKAPGFYVSAIDGDRNLAPWGKKEEIENDGAVRLAVQGVDGALVRVCMRGEEPRSESCLI